MCFIRALTHKGERVEFVNESLVFTREDSPMANPLLGKIAVLAKDLEIAPGRALAATGAHEVPMRHARLHI